MSDNYKKITRKVIAEKVGASVSVVSRALNNSGYVSADKKKRIIEVANELGYSPNPIAMALQQQKTYQLLFFCSDMTGAYFNQMHHGMVKAAESRGYHIQAISNLYKYDIVKRIFVDGILFPTESIAEEFIDSVGKNYHIPAVTASFEPTKTYRKPIPSVVIDNYKVINGLIDYLMSHGHRKIGFILPFNTGYATPRYNYWKERMNHELGDGYAKYLIDVNDEAETPKLFNRHERLGYNCDETGFVFYDLISLGRKAADIYMKSKSKATAYIVYNDDLAFGFMQEIIKKGVSIPRDLSIVGIDGIYTRKHFEPKLTTMSLYPDRHGALVVNLLIDILEGKKYKYIGHAPYGILEGETVRSI